MPSLKGPIAPKIDNGVDDAGIGVKGLNRLRCHVECRFNLRGIGLTRQT